MNDVCDCPACGGTGFVSSYGDYGNCHYGAPDDPERLCPFCHGTGESDYDMAAFISNLQSENLLLRDQIAKLLEEVRKHEAGT